VSVGRDVKPTSTAASATHASAVSVEGLEVLPPKSRISKEEGPKYFAAFFEDKGVVVPEEVLLRFGLLREGRHGWYVVPQLKPFIKLVELKWYGSRRHGRYYVKRVYNPDGTIYKEFEDPKGEDNDPIGEFTTWYNGFLSLWDTALKTAVVPKDLTVHYHGSNVDDGVAYVSIDGSFIKIEWRKTYTIINGPKNILSILAASPELKREGFFEGMYGGLISKKVVSEKDLKDWLESLGKAIASEIEKNKDRILRDVVLKVEAEKKDIEAARKQLHIDVPGDRPVTADDVLALATAAKPGGEGEAEVEEVAEEGGAKPTGIELPEVEVEVVQPTGAETTAVGEVTEAKPKEQLVKVYLLVMKLPSKYLVQKVTFEKGAEGFVEKRAFEGVASAVASRLEGIRRGAYDRISRAFAFVEDFGTWVAVTEDAVKEAQEVSKWVREELGKIPQLTTIKAVDLSRYEVKAVPIYLEPKDAKELLNAAVKSLSTDVEELKRRIEEAAKEERKSALAKLQKEVEYKTALLNTFKKQLEKL